MDTKTDVLIVGGGLTGLTSAALLAYHGVDCMVIERHSGTSIQYKFAGISPRSMEIFRSIGLEEEIRANRTGDQQAGLIGRGRTLSDPAIQWSGQAWPDASPYSPTQPATCDQHVLEPLLKRHATRMGATMAFGTDFIALEQDGDGVQVRLRDRRTETDHQVTASYVIGADGANGTVRKRLGIRRRGPGVLQHWMNVIFETDMPATIDGKRFTSCFVTDLNGALVPRGDGRWLMALQYFPEQGESPEDFDEARCRALVMKGAGRSDIRVRLVDARAWAVAASVAARFQQGRCFLVGDAAHLMPPTGAFGGNTGVHDAHNLAWKLAYVLKGYAGPGLLETYDSERRPVVEHSLQQALARLQQWFKDPGRRLPPPVEMVDDYDVVFGQRYETGAVIGAETGFGPFEKAESLSGRPGTRMPHSYVGRRDEKISTHDLPGRDFALLAGPSRDWHAIAERTRRRTGVPLRRHALDESVLRRDFDLAPDGAVLVRPDGFVAWRSDRVERTDCSDVEGVMRSLLSKSPVPATV